MKKTRKPDSVSETRAAENAGESPPGHPDQDIETRVAEAAYFLAERRGFAPGFELEDWLMAEAQIREQTPSS